MSAVNEDVLTGKVRQYGTMMMMMMIMMMRDFMSLDVGLTC